MAPIAGYDKIADKDIMTTAELNIIVAILYLSTFLFICELAMAVYNIWAFLIKQKKYKTLPLSIFYALTVWLMLMRIYFCLFYLTIIENESIVGSCFKPILKLDIGLVQCWILIELSLRISKSIKQTETFISHTTSQVGQNNVLATVDKTQRFITLGRIVLLCFVLIQLPVIFALFIY